MNAEPAKGLVGGRRWCQFSLRTLAIVVVAVSIALSLFAARLHRARKQKAAAEFLAAHGYVVYDFQYRKRGNSRHDINATSPLPRWLLDRLGDDFFHGVSVVSTEIDGHSPESQDQILRAIEQIPQLRQLHLEADPPVEANIASLNFGRNLEELSLGGNFRLRSLSQIESLPKLTVLSLSDGAIHRSSLGSLALVPKLAELRIKNIDLDEGDFTELAKCPHLRRLDINGIAATSRDVEALSTMRQLSSLRLARAQITDGDLSQIVNLDRLLWLDVSYNDITDAGLSKLETLSRLETLVLEGTSVTSQGIEQFRQNRPDVFVTGTLRRRVKSPIVTPAPK